MHFVTLLTLALTAFTSTTRAGTLHDRRRENLNQQMRRNKAPAPPPASELSSPGSFIATTTALEGLNSTISLDPTGVVQTLSATSELLLTSETAAADACPLPLTVTITQTETSISTIQVCGTQTGDENTAPAIGDPTQVITESLATTALVSGDLLFSSSSIAIPTPTESAAIDQPIISQPTPLEDGAITTQIITQTISSPATTLVSEFVTCRGRGKNQRCKVTTVTEEQQESVGIETVTLIVTQSEGVNLVTRESGVADTPTATVVDGIATETAAPAPSAPQGQENAVETPVLVTNGNAAVESSTSCADAGATLTSIVTIDASASSSEVASETTVPILTTQNPVNESSLSSEPTISASASITISAVAPDANENIVTESMISIITMTRSVVPIEITLGTGATQETAIVTPQPETILSTITLGPGGISGTGTDAAQPTGRAGNRKGRGKDKKKKKKGKGKGQGKEDENGKVSGNGGKNDGKEEGVKGNDGGPDRYQNNAGSKAKGNGKAEYDIDD